MTATGTSSIQVPLDPSSVSAATEDLLTSILRSNPRASDLIFSPGKKFQVQENGKFVPAEMPRYATLSADDTRRIASDLIGNNKAAIGMLREQGYCDVSYALPGFARFRVNIFIQRGSCAVAVRVIPTVIPDFTTLGLPDQLRQISTLHDGLVLLTGPRSSGKSSTLAAILNHINETETCHIITIEDPIEFLHNHQRSTIHQRELYSDTPTMAQAMRAALRQASNVIAVGDLKDQESMELALEAAETGHLVISMLNTLDARQTIERFLSAFPAAAQASVRSRLGRTLRYVVSQRLLPRKLGVRRVPVFEVLQSGSKPLEDLLSNSDGNGVQTTSRLDLEIANLVLADMVTPENALAHSLDARELAKRLGVDQK
jgi:twitching motility protein PilT